MTNVPHTSYGGSQSLLELAKGKIGPIIQFQINREKAREELTPEFFGGAWRWGGPSGGSTTLGRELGPGRKKKRKNAQWETANSHIEKEMISLSAHKKKGGKARGGGVALGPEERQKRKN